MALEALGAQHLPTFCQLRRQGGSLNFWRTRAGLEGDFVMYGPNLLWDGSEA